MKHNVRCTIMFDYEHENISVSYKYLLFSKLDNGKVDEIRTVGRREKKKEKLLNKSTEACGAYHR